MKHIATLLLGAAAISGTVWLLDAPARGVAAPRAPATSGLEGDVRSLVAAVPFTLEESWTHAWRAERPTFRAGHLLVLEVDPMLVVPTELAQPVLCGGVETLERMHHGNASGRVVAILPSALGADGLPEVDLASTPFWFASPALPEELGARRIAKELELAVERGSTPFSPAAIAAASRRGGAPIVVQDRVELDRLAAQWILEHAPEERARAEQHLVPVTR